MTHTHTNPNDPSLRVRKYLVFRRGTVKLTAGHP